MELDEAFSHVLRELRNEHNISQENLALESGLDRSYISLLERGLRQPSLKTIFQLSKALNIKPNELIELVANKLDIT